MGIILLNTNIPVVDLNTARTGSVDLRKIWLGRLANVDFFFCLFNLGESEPVLLSLSGKSRRDKFIVVSLKYCISLHKNFSIVFTTKNQQPNQYSLSSSSTS